LKTSKVGFSNKSFLTNRSSSFRFRNSKNEGKDLNYSLERNNTWKLVKHLADKKAIDVEWVYKLKHYPDDSISKHKARLVARGFLQRGGLDYSKVYAPVSRIETVMLVIALACKRNRSTFHLDVKYAFLNGPIDEVVFLTQNMVCMCKQLHLT
jgi:hypothetical protein